MTIRINALPEATNPAASSFLAVDGATTEKATLQKVVDAGAPVASEAEARAGADNAKRMTALRVKQSINEEIGNTIASAASGALANTAVQPGDLGNSAGLDIGTTAGTVAAGDDERIVGAIRYTVKGGTAAQIQAAIDAAPSGASVLVRLSGEISMPTSVTENGRDVSFEIDPGTTFTGAGSLPAYGSPSFFGVDARNIEVIRKRGSASHPVTDSTEPIAALIKYTDIDVGLHDGLNATLVAVNYKYNSGPHANAIGAFFEGVDVVGWDGDGPIAFVEGMRANGLVMPGASGGSGYGAIVNGIANDVDDYKCVVGIEAGALLFGSISDQPGWAAFNPGDKIAAAYNAATSGAARPDALFLANPFNANTDHAAATGVAITENSVWDVAFASNATCHKGMDLSLGSYDQGAVLIPNNSDISARKADGSGYQSLIYCEPTANKPVIGGGAPEVIINAPMYVGGGTVIAGNIGVSADNAFDLGSGGFRIRNSFFANNPTVGSDAKLKKLRGPLTEAEISAAKSIPIKVFQYLSAVEEKGGAARLHIGVIAQDVIAAFDRQGLDAFAYGIVGRDPEIKSVRKKRVVSRQVMDDHDEEYVDYIERDGALVMTKKTRRVQRGIIKVLPIVNDAGEPVLGMAGVVDSNGMPIFEKVEVHDKKTGKTHVIERQRKELSPMTRSVPLCEDVEEIYYEDEPTGEYVLSIRYEQLAMLIISALQTEGG